MDLNNQLEIIRKNKHAEYLKQMERISAEQEKINDALLLDKKVAILTNLSHKYAYLSDANPREYAAYRIQKFIKNYWFSQKCINENDISVIPGIYRMRINITNYHTNHYTEADISSEMINMYRLMYNISHPLSISGQPRVTLFRYCFDIRKLYYERDNNIDINRELYYLQPEDHARIEIAWKKINNETNFSIRYMTQFEYDKSLTHDRDPEPIKKLTSEKIREIIIDSEAKLEFDEKIIHELVEKYVVEL